MTTQQRPVRADGGAIADLPGLRDQTRVFLQPVAAPSILGLFGFAAATFMVAAHLAGWYGDAKSPTFLFPFAATFGGIAQFVAGVWSYRARDGLATAMHGMWGAFWMAFGILFLLVATGDLTVPTGTFTEFGFWFLTLAAITAVGAVAAAAENLGLTAVLTTLAVGSGLLAVGYLAGGETGAIGWIKAGAWVLIVSSIFAWYTASALMLKSSYGRAILPLGERSALPGEPGVKRGQ